MRGGDNEVRFEVRRERHTDKSVEEDSKKEEGITMEQKRLGLVEGKLKRMLK